jgi:hypothetical protein
MITLLFTKVINISSFLLQRYYRFGANGAPAAEVRLPAAGRETARIARLQSR